MMESSFWGVIIKPEKRYEQTVEKSFHVSKATIEPGTSSKVTSVYIEVDNQDEFLICNLSDKNLNETLDLNFMEGEKICFKTTGGGTIHLTGYLLPDTDIDESYMMGSEAEEASSDEESIEEEEEEEEMPQLVNGKNNKKRKKESMEVALTNGTPSKKKKIANSAGDNDAASDKKKDVKKAQNMKKQLEEMTSSAKKLSQDSDEDDDDESSDDGIMDYTDNYAEENDSPESEDSDDDGESDDDDEDDDEDEEDDDDESEEEEEKEVIKKETKKSKVINEKSPIKNGTSTPQTPKDKKQKNGETPGKKLSKDKTPNKTVESNGITDSAKKSPKNKTPSRVIKGGIKIEDIKIGSGPEAKKGKMLGMYYDGKLKSNNKRFDANLSGKPFKFRLGSGEVIKGWDLGLEGIKVGGKRRLTLPPNMAYGSQGAPPDIPPNSTLVFEVECKHVN